MRVLEFWVPGCPVPKERARTVRTKYGKLRTFTPKRTEEWEERVRLVAQAACSAARWKPGPAAYAVEVTVHRARRAGDIDNLGKAILDSCNKVIWPDDRHVWRMVVERFDGREPGVRIRVTRDDGHVTLASVAGMLWKNEEGDRVDEAKETTHKEKHDTAAHRNPIARAHAARASARVQSAAGRTAIATGRARTRARNG